MQNSPSGQSLERPQVKHIVANNSKYNQEDAWFKNPKYNQRDPNDPWMKLLEQNKNMITLIRKGRACGMHKRRKAKCPEKCPYNMMKKLSIEYATKKKERDDELAILIEKLKKDFNRFGTVLAQDSTVLSD
jgi:hypothetical protein